MAEPFDRSVVEIALRDEEVAFGSESASTWNSWFLAREWTRPDSRSFTG